MKLLAGNSNLPLAKAIADYLELPLTEASVRRFADEEIFVEINENVRGEDVFVVQSTSYPANDNLMELLICIDALRRASAKRITAVIPYFGYARQDRKPGPRTPISAKLVANLITAAGANRVLSIDLHAGQIQGFFDIPTDNLFAAPVMAADIQARLSNKQSDDRLARRRRRGSRPRPGQAARQRAAGDRRQAPRAGRRIRSDEHHRRRRGPHLHPDRRHRRFGRHALQRRRRAYAAGRRARSSPIAPTACCPAARQRASTLRSSSELVVTDSIWSRRGGRRGRQDPPPHHRAVARARRSAASPTKARSRACSTEGGCATSTSLKKGPTRSGASSPTSRSRSTFPEGIPNFEPRDVRITDRAPVVRFNRDRGTAELVERRWSWPAPNGKPVFNMRSDGREFGRDRCLVIADGFYEFTAPADPEAEAKGLLAVPPGRRRAVRHRRRGAERCERRRGVHLAHCSARDRHSPLSQPPDRPALAAGLARLAGWFGQLEGAVASGRGGRPVRRTYGGLSLFARPALSDHANSPHHRSQSRDRPRVRAPICRRRLGCDRRRAPIEPGAGRRSRSESSSWT